MHCLRAVLYSILLFSLVGKMSIFFTPQTTVSFLATNYPVFELLKLPFSQLFMPSFLYFHSFSFFSIVYLIVFPIHCFSVYFSIYTLAHTTKLIDLWCAFDLFCFFFLLSFFLTSLRISYLTYYCPLFTAIDFLFVENWEIAVKKSTQPRTESIERR